MRTAALCMIIFATASALASTGLQLMSITWARGNVVPGNHWARSTRALVLTPLGLGLEALS